MIFSGRWDNDLNIYEGIVLRFSANLGYWYNFENIEFEDFEDGYTNNDAIDMNMTFDKNSKNGK